MKKTPWKIGLLQAAGVAGYVLLISGALSLLQAVLEPSSDFVAATLMLTLLVFSAAATGSMVFGYPAYLMFNKRAKEAVQTFAYTLGFLLLAVILILLLGARFL